MDAAVPVEQVDPLADVFPGTEDADLPEWQYWAGRFRGHLIPPRPKQEER